MANRIPLIVDSSTLNIKELPVGDSLELANSSLINVATTTVKVNSLGLISTNTALDVGADNFFVGTANDNVVFSFTGTQGNGVGESFVLQLANGGNYTITWPATVYWPSATAPTLSTGNTDVLIFITVNGGSTWHGASQLAYTA